MSRGVIAVSLALAFAALSPGQQPPAKDAKTPSAPAVKPGPDPKSTVETPKSEPKKTPAKSVGAPPDAVIAIVGAYVKDLISLDPKTLEPLYFLVPSDQYRQDKARLAALEKQLKADRKSPSSCKLSGRVEGDLVHLRAEFGFSTESPNTQVLLGMQGAHLADEGMLDRSAAVLDVGDEGIVARVEREGTHQLVLNLRIPAPSKRSGTLGGVERGFDLGLPGASVTTLTFETPAAVKELRWGDSVEKNRIQGKWELTLGKAKTLALQWREPISVPGGGPQQVVEATAVVRVLASHLEMQADLVLEDLRGQTKEWVLLLPPQARVVKTVPAVGIEIVPSDGKTPHPVLKLKEPTFERIVVTIEARLPRQFPQQRVMLGPFTAQNATRHQGTIAVRGSAEALRGQRPIFHRSSDMFQREPTASEIGAETLGFFQFWDSAGNRTKPGLDLELRAEKSPIEVQTELDVTARDEGAWRLLSTEIRFQGKASVGGFESLDVQLPAPRMPGVGVVMSPVAAVLSGWSGYVLSVAGSDPTAAAGWYSLPDESDASSADASKRLKLKLPANNGVAVIRGRHWVLASAERVRLELPRPIGVVDRGGKETIAVPRNLELLVGALNEPALERHELRTTFESLPTMLEWSWRPFRPEITAAMKIDLQVQERSARVRQAIAIVPGLRAPRSGGSGGQVPLRLPQGVVRPTVAQGGSITATDGAIVWLQPETEQTQEIVLEYELKLPKRESTGRNLEAAFVWPELATRQETKVRVWTESGVVPRLTAHEKTTWRDRGTEIVANQDVLPSRVMTASGAMEAMPLSLDEAGQAPSLPFLSDRALVQVQLDDAGNQQYRARFLVKKFFARQLDIELPTPVDQAQPQIVVDGKILKSWSRPEGAANIMRLEIDPAHYPRPTLLEIAYTIPAGAMEGYRSWSTNVAAPRFGERAYAGQVRWQVGLPKAAAAFLVGSTPVDFQWTWQRWLLAPEPSLTSQDLEQSFGAQDGEETPVSITFTRTGLEPVTVFALPRVAWLMLCSATVLLLGLAIASASWIRGWRVWLGAVAMVAVLWLGMFNQSFAAALLFGMEPGIFILVVLLGAQWLARVRYRRRMVFMPGFTRKSPGSSLVRTAKRMQPSTIDAPPGTPISQVK